MKNVAIIPARSGSKGIPNKNILPLAGKPLMAWTIEAAVKSGIFDKVVVSTDSEEYAAIAREWGADVPFLRSEKTANDTATCWDVCREVLDSLSAIDEEFETFTLLQPTSPLRTAEDIIEAHKLYVEKDAKAVVSVSVSPRPPFALNTLPESLSMDNFYRRETNRPRQAFDKYYYVNGAICMVRVATFPEDNYIYRDNLYAYVMKEHNGHDIDTELDFAIAETIIEKFM